MQIQTIILNATERNILSTFIKEDIGENVDFNKLMFVVDLIESKGFSVNILSASEVTIPLAGKDGIRINNSTSKLNSILLAVLEFIKWYEFNLCSNDVINNSEPISDERELFFLDCIKDLVEEKTDNEYQSIIYRKPNNDDIWFELWVDQDLKNKILSCSYKYIWSIFEHKFGMKYDDIQSFISDMVLKHTEWGVVTPIQEDIMIEQILKHTDWE